MVYDWYPATRGDIRRLEKKMSDQQTQINNITAEIEATKTLIAAVQVDTQTINDEVTDLEATVNSLKAAITDAQKAQPALDLTGLQTAADSVSSQVGSLKTAAEQVLTRLAPLEQAPVV